MACMGGPGGPENGTKAWMEKWAVAVRTHPYTQQHLSPVWQRAVNGETARLRTRASVIPARWNLG